MICLLWIVVLVCCWPLAVLALVALILFPLTWHLLLPLCALAILIRILNGRPHYVYYDRPHYGYYERRGPYDPYTGRRHY